MIARLLQDGDHIWQGRAYSRMATAGLPIVHLLSYSGGQPGNDDSLSPCGWLLQGCLWPTSWALAASSLDMGLLFCWRLAWQRPTS